MDFPLKEVRIESMDTGESTSSKKEATGDSHESSKKEEETYLVFLGTFFHDNYKIHNLDLIQFKEPVKLQGVRVIPLGAKVNLSNESFQLGATNPSELDLEFYFNDLQNPTKSTFTLLEKFNYHEKHSIHFNCESEEKEVFTDGILVRGLYATLTVAAYGYHVDRDAIKINQEEKLSQSEEPAQIPSPVEETLEKDEVIDIVDLTEVSDKHEETNSIEKNDEEPESIVPAPSLENADKEAIAIIIPEEAPQAIPTINTRFSSVSPLKQQLTPVSTSLEPDILIEEKAERISSEEEHFDDGQDMEIDDQEEDDSVANTDIPPPFIETEDISDEEITCEPIDEKEDFSDLKSPESKVKSTEPILDSDKDDQQASFGIEDQKDLAIDSSHELLSDEDSFGEDFSEYVEQISDDELGDFEDEESYGWEDFSFEKPNVDCNPLSSTFQVVALKKISIESFVLKSSKHEKLVLNQVIHNLRRFAETSFNEHLMETWVEGLEQILPVLPATLPLIEAEASDCINILSFWVKLGIDLDLVKKHTSPPFIVRHLKAGLRLTHALCSYGGSFLEKTLRFNSSLHWRLISILEDTMLKASVIQRLVYNIIDTTFDSRNGWEMFKSDESLVNKLCYFLQQNVESRCAIIIRGLQRKMALANYCSMFHDFALDLESNLIPNYFIDFLFGLDELRMLASEYLKENSTQCAELDSSVLFGSNPKVGFFRLLRDFNFMKCLAIILYHPQFVPTPLSANTRNCLTEILQYMSKWEIGLVYLCSEEECTKIVIRKLAKNGKYDSVNIFLTSLCLELQLMKDNDSLVDACTCPEEEEIDNNSLKRMYSLLSTSYGREALVKIFSQGDQIQSLLRIIRLNENPDILSETSLQMINSCRKGYATPILVHVVKFSDNFQFLRKNGAEIHDTIVSLSEEYEGLDKLKVLLPFLKVTADSNNFTFENIEALCQLLETQVAENLLMGPKVSDNNYGFTPEIITILRIFSGLAILKSNMLDCSCKEDDLPNLKQLDCVRNYVEMNSKDIITTIVKILKKVNLEFEQSFCLSALLVGPFGDALSSMLLPLSQLLRHFLAEVVEVRKSDYRDLEPAEALINVYGILKNFPTASKSIHRVQECLYNIVETIGSCAIPLSNLKVDEESEEQLKNCMWTRTISAIFKFIQNAPYNVKPGFELLLELMPNASPVITKIDLSTDEESSINVNQRRWGIYMHGVTEEIQEVVGTYCITNDQNLLDQLKKFCGKLANLSASNCLMICRTIMDKIFTLVENDCEINKPEGSNVAALSINAWVQTSVDRRLISCSPETANCLRFLSSLVRSSSRIKVGVLNVGRASSKLDEKYAPFVGLLCNILTSFPVVQGKTSTPSHCQGQKYIISIFQSFCDIDNNIFGVCQQKNYSSEQILSNSLPIKENFGFIASALLSLLRLEQLRLIESEDTVKSIFTTLETLIETDYGFHHLKMAMLNLPTQINAFLEALAKETKVVSTINSLVECCTYGFIRLLNRLINPKEYKDNMTKSRTAVLQSFELRKFLQWDTEGAMPRRSKGPHHLEQILWNLEHVSADIAQTMEYFTAIQQLNNVLQWIKKEEKEYVTKTEVVLPPPDIFTELFALQPVTKMGTYSEDNSLGNTNGGSDEENQQPEMVPIDFVELSQSVLKLDILTEVKSVYNIKDLCNVSGTRSLDNVTTDKPVPLDHSHSFKTPGFGVGVSHRKPITYHQHPATRGNTRGGFGRGISPGSNLRGSHFDPFRSRPPNTSRPPSLHVDDFVAMESSSGSNQPLRTNMRNMATGQELFMGRGRGHRGRPYDSDRGRPFRPQSQMNTPYYAQGGSDQNMTRGRGSRGRGWAMISDPRSSPGRGNYSSRPEQGGRMMNYNPSDDNYRNSSNLSTPLSRSVSSSSVGPIRNSPGSRYSRQPYREAPPSKAPSSSSTSWRDKTRPSYNR